MEVEDQPIELLCWVQKYSLLKQSSFYMLFVLSNIYVAFDQDSGVQVQLRACSPQRWAARWVEEEREAKVTSAEPGTEEISVPQRHEGNGAGAGKM